MAKEFVGSAFLLGLIVLGAALFLPPMMDVTAKDSTKVLQLNQSESFNITSDLEITLDRVNSSTVNNSTADLDVTYLNKRTLASNQTTLNETETGSVVLSGDTIQATADDIIDNSTAQITSQYPPMFGWDSGPRTFVENLDVVLMLFGFTLIMLSLFGFVEDL